MRSSEQRQHEQRNADDRLEEPHQELVDPAADEPAREADQTADHGRDERAREGEIEHVAGAVDNSAEHVAAEDVGAEEVRAARAGVGQSRARLERVVRIPQGACQRDQEVREQEERREP